MINKVIFLFWSLLFTSCTQVYQIGLKEHSFASQPRKIVWVQIAGFDINHLGLLKLTEWAESRGGEYQNFMCLGHMWDYSLFELRPSAYESMHAQVTGKSNSQESCDDFKEKPFWAYLGQDKGFEVYIIEQGRSIGSGLLASTSCPTKGDWLLNVSYIDRKGVKGSKKNYQKFHYSDSKQLKAGDFYEDKSCQQGSCFSSLQQVLKSLYDRNLKNESKFVINVRDFSYQDYLERGQYKKAAIFLQDLEKTFDDMKKLYSDSELLFLISGASARPMIYPKTGKDWKRLEKRNAKILRQKSSLSSPVLAYGARAENFCGIYRQSEAFQRVFYDKKRMKIGLD